jgi:type I restriction enzyme S subunit
MPNLNTTIMAAIPFAFPPDSEQRAIARILGTLDDKIELNRRMNQTLEALARAIFQSWFVDFEPVTAKAAGRKPIGMTAETAALFPDSFEDSPLGPIPKEWRTQKIGSACEFAYGKSLIANKRRPGPVAVFGSDGQVGWHDTALSNGPGVIVGRKGNAGRVNWSSGDFFPIDTTFYVKPRTPEIPISFLFFMLESVDLPGSSGDSAVPGLNRELAYLLDVTVPSLPALQRFDQIVTKLRQRMGMNDTCALSAAALRDAMLPRLLSGEMRVKEAEKMLA